MTQHEASRLDKMEEKLDEVAETVKEIYVSLKGSDLTGKGLKERVDEMDDRVKNLEKYVFIGIGIGSTIGVLWGIIQLFK